ncbi:hypothetical protein [Streptomyces sp. NPDC048272]|uniref:hypothetical protein n=1 Tax=Streptomyces sp. NPDC048272 TaxID=3154616 RepID=UPI00341E7601
MNRYGRKAPQHWQVHRLQRVTGLADPEEFFAWIEAELQRKVSAPRASGRVLVPAAVRKAYLERAGRLEQWWLEVEGGILRELVLLPAEGDENPDDDAFLSPEEPAGEQWRVLHLHKPRRQLLTVSPELFPALLGGDYV